MCVVRETVTILLEEFIFGDHDLNSHNLMIDFTKKNLSDSI